MKLHKEHGLNPTISQCFYCGKEKNELVLLGASCKEQAPMLTCFNKEPCDKCKKMMTLGVLLISVADNSDKVNPYRTGKICVIKIEAAKRIFNNIGESRVAFIEDSVWNKLHLPK